MLNIGWGEMLVVLVVAMIVFGPNRLPEIARSLGKFIRNFQQETNRALSDLKSGLDSPTAGIFDEPDEGASAPTEDIAPDAALQFTPAAEIAATAHVATRAQGKRAPKKRSTSTRLAASKRSAPAKRSTAKRAPAKRPAAKRPAAKRPAAPRRSPKKKR